MGFELLSCGLVHTSRLLCPSLNPVVMTMAMVKAFQHTRTRSAFSTGRLGPINRDNVVTNLHVLVL